MLAFFYENRGTLAVCLLIAAVAAGILIKHRHDKRQKRCGSGCGSCPHATACRKDDP